MPPGFLAGLHPHQDPVPGAPAPTPGGTARERTDRTSPGHPSYTRPYTPPGQRGPMTHHPFSPVPSVDALTHVAALLAASCGGPSWSGSPPAGRSPVRADVVMAGRCGDPPLR
ncbi:hypothetical protein SGPA1_20693 [Streptomyces misionensis JCM 4497]